MERTGRMRLMRTPALRSRARVQLSVLSAPFLALLLVGCQRSAPESSGAAGGATAGAELKAGLSILAGSENRSLEPLLQQFSRAQGIPIKVSYLGSVEI